MPEQEEARQADEVILEIPGREPQVLSVLVVDDDESVRRMLELALSRKGYEVETVADGETAIRRLRDRPFDIAVSDVHMPDVDGLALAEVARSIRPGMGLVLITGFGTEQSVMRAFQRGAAAFLKKPLQLPALYRTIRLVAESIEDLPPEPVELCVGRGPEEATCLLGLEVDDEGWINFKAPSHRAFLDRFANLCELLLARGLDTDTVEEIRVAILELGSNAIEWGHAHDASRPITLSARLLSDRLVVVVEDCGAGFCPEHVPDPARDARKLQRQRQAQGKRPGGYGIALVKAITDHLVYNERGNLVAMVKTLHARPSAG
jgi:CheY-like chemotaxis protein